MTVQITALPIPPSRDDPANFAPRADAFLMQLPTFATEANALAVEANTNTNTATTKAAEALASANAASTSASQALVAQLAAAASASAAESLVGPYLGVSPTDPLTGHGGIPLVDGAWYINSTTGFIRAYTTAGGWVNGITAIAGVSAINGQSGALTVKTLHGVTALGAGDFITYTTTAASKSIANMEHCSVTTGACTITLPPTPLEGYECYISVGDFQSTIIARNGSTIFDLAEDLTIDKSFATVTFRYKNSTWRII